MVGPTVGGPDPADEPAAGRDPGLPPDEAQARELCLRLLTTRPHSRAELRSRLLRRAVPEEVADAVLDRFDEVGLVDDAAFAEAWVHSRHTQRGLGRRALLSELRRKGVNAQVAAEALDTVDGEAEEERARQLVRRKMRSTGGVDAQARVRRLVGMLARKGYSQGLAFRVVREELAEEGAEEDVLDELRERF
ncbi:regulatory protein RecX [Actinoalloteichus spitiensis]|uniref:regulatory protein RecX n=1 Tax=Actinoalloteichus spitiensis TaxID=252394 RepID=UPI000373E2C2|nr:regulatory protein RecX [Actinoalloteichus spitiensis]